MIPLRFEDGIHIKEEGADEQDLKEALALTCWIGIPMTGACDAEAATRGKCSTSGISANS